MKVLLINDTRIETNPGCHATVNELISFIKEHLNVSKLETIPVGTSYNIFERNDLYSPSFFHKVKNKILSHNFLYFNLSKWKKIARNSLPEKIKQKIGSSDIVIINMEGTIHHNSIGALTLLAFVYYSYLKRKKVAMVNGSYQEVNNKLTNFVLKKVDFFSVRESFSYKYLNKKFKKIKLIPDFAFKANIYEEHFESDIFFKSSNESRCLYTPGVLAVYPEKKNGIDFIQIEDHITQIRSIGFEPYFLKIEENEKFIEEKFKNLGVKTISYSDGVSYKNIGGLLKSFDLLVTGRYHIGIFGLMSQIETYFLPSNTYKIEGLLDFLGLERSLIINNQIKAINKSSSFNVEEMHREYEPFRLFLESV
jgi:polysaccharide pyruvyl transferase WcaK-like protein